MRIPNRPTPPNCRTEAPMNARALTGPQRNAKWPWVHLLEGPPMGISLKRIRIRKLSTMPPSSPAFSIDPFGEWDGEWESKSHSIVRAEVTSKQSCNERCHFFLDRIWLQPSSRVLTVNDGLGRRNFTPQGRRTDCVFQFHLEKKKWDCNVLGILFVEPYLDEHIIKRNTCVALESVAAV